MTSPAFDLLERMRFDPEEGIAELERHLARMKSSAEALGFAFDRHHVRNELQAATFFLRARRVLTLRLSTTGALAIETRALPEAPVGPVVLEAAPLPAERHDVRLAHMTSSSFDPADRVFVDGDGYVVVASGGNVFLERDGRLLTPPLSRGARPGILRERLLEEGRAVEAELRLEDLRQGYYIGDAVRGLIAARLAETRT